MDFTCPSTRSRDMRAEVHGSIDVSAVLALLPPSLPALELLGPASGAVELVASFNDAPSSGLEVTGLQIAAGRVALTERSMAGPAAAARARAEDRAEDRAVSRYGRSAPACAT